MGFSRQKYWSGLLCPPPGDLPDPGIEPAGGFFSTHSECTCKTVAQTQKHEGISKAISTLSCFPVSAKKKPIYLRYWNKPRRNSRVASTMAGDFPTPGKNCVTASSEAQDICQSCKSLNQIIPKYWAEENKASLCDCFYLTGFDLLPQAAYYSKLVLKISSNFTYNSKVLMPLSPSW